MNALNSDEVLETLRKNFSDFGITSLILPIDCTFGNSTKKDSYLSKVSGFSGSSAQAFIMNEKAYLLIDGRYTKQASIETSEKWTLIDYPSQNLMDIIKENITPESVIGFIPIAHSYKTFLELNALVAENRSTIKSINLDGSSQKNIDDYSLKLLEIDGVVETTKNRIDLLKNKINDDETFLFSGKIPISWITNLRRSKLSDDYSSIVNAIIIIQKKHKALLFTDVQIEENAKENLGKFIEFFDINDFNSVTKERINSVNILTDLAQLRAKFALDLIENNFQIEQINFKIDSHIAVKTKTEIESMKNGALQLSKAIVKTLAFIEHKIENNKKITEKDTADFLQNHGKTELNAVGLSFAPIIAAGLNSEVVHYSPTEHNFSEIAPDSLLLLDCGLHFNDSSTDSTRTIFLGNNPPNIYKKAYTVILKSIINLSESKVPYGIEANTVDAMARSTLQTYFNDYGFGTGHGVGNFANVHEPPFVSKKSKDKITEDMVFTVEPGIYEHGFGIRLENMLLTVKVEKNLLVFETLTLIPLEMKLIDKSILEKNEIDWINNYNKKTRDVLINEFKNDDETVSWIMKNTYKL